MPGAFHSDETFRHEASLRNIGPFFLNSDADVMMLAEAAALVGEDASASLYRPHLNSYVPDEVVQFAERVAKVWGPARAYVMDVTDTADGEMKVVEYNCINGSAFYAADAQRIIMALTNLA